MPDGARRVVVHIGLEKAASTTLQASLVAASAEMARRGIAYPRIGGGSAKVQRAVHEAVAPGGDEAARAAAREALRAAASQDCHTLVLSGETLHSHGPDALRRFLAGAGWADAQVTALALVREPAGWLNSRYAFRTSMFRHSERFARFVRASLRRGAVDWERVFAAWLEAPDISFAAVPLAARGDPRPVVVRALAAAGLGDVPLAGSVQRNEAVDPRTVEAARRLRRYRLPQRHGQRLKVRNVLFGQAVSEGWSGRFQGLDEALAAHIDAATRAGNDRFAQRVWGAPWEAVYDMPQRRGLVPNEWPRGAMQHEEAALARVVETVAQITGLARRPFSGIRAAFG